jgi:hypothetical protein
MFARAAPAKKSELGRLAGLFKRVEQKKHARAADASATPAATEAAVPETAAVLEPAVAPEPAAAPAASVPRGPMDAFAKLRAYAEANKKRRRA